MKRGIPIALQAAGAVLACLVTTLNHPVIANEQTVYQDTVHYYDWHGTEIYCKPDASSAGNYIIRTFKRRRWLFDDWYGRKNDSSDYSPATVCRIKRREARKTRRRIHEGNVTDPLVVKCIVPILDKGTIKKMLYSILAMRSKDGSDSAFREYGGKINGDTTFKCEGGDSTYPCQPKNKGLDVKLGKRGNFHSHPEGVIEIIDSNLIELKKKYRLSPGNAHTEVFSSHGETKICKFVQGPSRRDQQSIEDKTGYVFGMRYGLVYVYDKHGVCATLPFSSLPSQTR